jgi:hypothetical protein
MIKLKNREDSGLLENCLYKIICLKSQEKKNAVRMLLGVRQLPKVGAAGQLPKAGAAGQLPMAGAAGQLVVVVGRAGCLLGPLGKRLLTTAEVSTALRHAFTQTLQFLIIIYFCAKVRVTGYYRGERLFWPCVALTEDSALNWNW